MRKVWIVAAVVAVTALGGCKKKSEQDMVEVPPPPPMDAPAAYSPAPADTMAPAASLDGTTYTVQRGDTLWSIAQRHYGDGKKWKDIAAANGNIDPRQLKAGQTLTLP